MQVAMDLALISLQRRGDRVRARYDRIEGDVWQVIQSKTEKHDHRAFLKITMGEGPQEVIQRSRSIAPVCPFILHRVPERKKKAAALEHWAQITPDHLSKTFAQLRDSLPEFLSMPREQRPGFHTIRGLGGHLYLEAGFDNEYVNHLFGHTQQTMSNEYTNQHVSWTEVRADL
ncbi:tyrosine-type recombinase/integrase [Saccharospirillum sp. HFRX-1]|uniref:tyrosine-type recombinase/integrase n=1 Tax=unclassified Saccharospirillum TaxID=2633430 RepID=UPI003712531D